MGLAPSICVETFGLVVLEAMVAGRPVIASRIGGLADLVVDGMTGLLVPPGDALALRDAIQRLLDNRSLAEAMGALGRKQAEAYRASEVIPRLERIYHRLIGAGAPDRRERGPVSPTPSATLRGRAGAR